MSIYMFVIKSQPLPESPHSPSTPYALAHVWVIDKDPDSAQERALNRIMADSWNPIQIEHAFEIQPEQIPSFHADEQLLYQRAQLSGMAVDYIAEPADDDPSGPIIRMPVFRP